MPKQELTPPLARIIEIARDIWWLDRPNSQTDVGTRLLLAALAQAFPNQVHTKETCTCGEPCEECASTDYVENEIFFMEGYMNHRAEIIAAADRQEPPT